MCGVHVCGVHGGMWGSCVGRRYLRVGQGGAKDSRTVADNDQQTISYLTGPGGQEVYLIGTAHISEQSAQQVKDVIRHVQPDVVFLELCHERAKRLRERPISDNETTALTEVFTSNEGPAWFSQILSMLKKGLPYTAIKGMYKYLSSLGFVPGVEFKAALDVVDDMRKEKSPKVPEVVLGDVSAEVTMKKLRNALSSFDMMKLFISPPRMDPQLMNELNEILGPIQQSNDIAQKVRESVEAMKYRPLVRKITKFSEAAVPQIAQVILHERDEHMVMGLRNLKGKKVVAIVGLAHMDGIERHWAKYK